MLFEESGPMKSACSFQFANATLLCIFASVTSAQIETGLKSTGEEIRQSVQRSIPYIEKGGHAWIEQKRCVTCHQVPQMIWALNLAKSHGLKHDVKGLQSANRWATQWKNLTKVHLRKEATEKETLLSENDAIAALLLGKPETNSGQEKAGWVEKYRTHLIESQLEDGSWTPMGQLPKQKRPLRETQEVSTMWALLGIATQSGQLEIGESYVQKSQRWLGKETVGLSTEWWATRLMLERALDNNQVADRIRNKLLEWQQEDGGWGWLCSERSDALGTGLAIFALAKDGIKTEDPKMRKAIQFLISAQNKDGSWTVRGTKESDRNRSVPTSDYWGTCWAVIGMLEAIDLKSSYASSN